MLNPFSALELPVGVEACPFHPAQLQQFCAEKEATRQCQRIASQFSSEGVPNMVRHDPGKWIDWGIGILIGISENNGVILLFTRSCNIWDATEIKNVRLSQIGFLWLFGTQTRYGPWVESTTNHKGISIASGTTYDPATMVTWSTRNIQTIYTYTSNIFVYMCVCMRDITCRYMYAYNIPRGVCVCVCVLRIADAKTHQ